jgi:heme/copper-type cytochrome/quinol oxidase subunit 2
MKIVNNLARIVLILVILFLVTRTFKRADELSYVPTSAAVFSSGNAPDSIRKEVLVQLYKFQEGYSKRDTSLVEPFMQSLYSKDNILILGAMPGEIFKDYKSATWLVKSDWESWGDCRFAMDSANISSKDNVAWFSARGYVKFDLSSLLVIPLRLSGVMVKEDGTWKFQKQQFQFDIDFSFSMLAAILLFVWLVVSVITLIVVIIKSRKKRTSGTSRKYVR